MSSQNNPQLCAICSSFLTTVTKVGNPFSMLVSSNGKWKFQMMPEAEAEVSQHYPSFHEFEQSASKGCHMCALFMLQLSERNRVSMRMHKVEGKGHGLITIRRHMLPTRAMYEVLLKYPMPKDMVVTGLGDHHFLKLYLRPIDEKSCESRYIPLTLKNLPSSSWEVIFTWIHNCVQNHQECRQKIFVAQQLPSRFIDVGEADDFSDVRLCNREEIGNDFQYATLSHCWGPNGLATKLLKPLLKEFITRIPWEHMPQTFKDAIIVTRKLRANFGIKYVWIDALCIVQDSEEDWVREAKVMGDYYRNSFCNLTACVGPDANSGLLHRRDPLSLHTCVVRIDHPSSIQGLFALENEGSLGSAVSSSTLNSRGWVLQEFHLAPRLLHFTPQELFWQCATLYARERQPAEMIPGLVTRVKRDTFDGPEVLQYKEGSAEYDYQIYRIWMNMVGEYTSRQLTKKNDKLVAISGIAKHMQQSLGDRDTYVCGLWKRHFALHLLWSVSSGAQRHRPVPYIAPSWSWASIEGRVYNHRTNQEAVEHTTPLITFEDPKLEYCYGDSFSTVNSATLKVTGHILKVELSKRGGRESDLAHLNWCGSQITTRPVQLDLRMPGTNPLPAYCLAIVLEKNEGAEEHLVGLLLRRVDGPPGRYERCGCFQLDFWIQIFMENAKAGRLSEDEYEMAHENGQVTVTLV